MILKKTVSVIGESVIGDVCWIDFGEIGDPTDQFSDLLIGDNASYDYSIETLKGEPQNFEIIYCQDDDALQIHVNGFGLGIYTIKLKAI